MVPSWPILAVQLPSDLQTEDFHYYYFFLNPYFTWTCSSPTFHWFIVDIMFHLISLVILAIFAPQSSPAYSPPHLTPKPTLDTFYCLTSFAPLAVLPASPGTIFYHRTSGEVPNGVLLDHLVHQPQTSVRLFLLTLDTESSFLGNGAEMWKATMNIS